MAAPMKRCPNSLIDSILYYKVKENGRTQLKKNNNHCNCDSTQPSFSLQLFSFIIALFLNFNSYFTESREF